MPVNGKGRKFGFPPTIRRYPRSLYCGAVFADGITSANVVGYQTKEILANDYTMFGVQFQGTDGEGVKLGDLAVSPKGGQSSAGSDNILVWENGVYTTYWFGTGWDDPKWDDFWYDKDENIVNDTVSIKPGVACWYLRRGEATTLTVSGQVKATATTTTILANDYTMFINPYPTAITFGNLKVAGPNGGVSSADGDNILVWEDGVYTTYWFGTGWDDPKWDDFWYDKDENIVNDTVSIKPGVACWYLRRGEATTISFTSPLAE